MKADKIGTGLSLLCVLHCTAVPLLLLLAPTAATHFLPDDDLTHQLLICGVVISALFAFLPGYRLHRQRSPLLAFGMGFVILAFATFGLHALDYHWLESPIAIFGSLWIILAHYLNHKACGAKHCEEHCHG